MFCLFKKVEIRKVKTTDPSIVLSINTTIQQKCRVSGYSTTEKKQYLSFTAHTYLLFNRVHVRHLHLIHKRLSSFSACEENKHYKCDTWLCSIVHYSDEPLRKYMIIWISLFSMLSGKLNSLQLDWVNALAGKKMK